MKTKRGISFVFATVFSAIILVVGVFLSTTFKTSEAITNTDTSSYVKVGDIWSDSKQNFDENNLNKLIQYVSGGASSVYNMSTINSMAASKTIAATIRSKTYNKTSSQDVIVTLGGLDWQVVYLSKDKGGNSILTLWLSNSTQSTFSGRSSTEGAYYGFLNGGLYSDWSANWSADAPQYAYPSNMYGSSYIRAVTLNNGGSYGVSGGASTSSASQSLVNVFAKFTMPSASGGLTNHIVKPSQVQWQEYGQNVKTRYNWPYSAPNENWSSSIPNSGTYQGETYSFCSFNGASYNYANKSLNNAWSNDYIWLPSITETGISDTQIGIWHTSTEQRKNYDGTTTSSLGNVGSTSGSASAYSWLRSGLSAYAYYAYSLNTSGAFNGDYNANYSRAVRPALHLNLNSAASAAVPEYTFRFNPNNGQSASSQSGIKQGAEYSGFPKPTKTGYTLSGWSYVKNGKTYYYYLSPSGTLTIPEVPEFSTTTVDFNAVWQANSYNISASANGGTISSTSGWSGSGSVAIKKVSYGSAYSTLPSVSRTGYNLKGWYDAASGGTQISTGTAMNKTSDHIIYAQWTIKNYAITFNSNGGSGTMSNQIVSHGSTVSLTRNAFKRSGYVFMGWATSSSGVVIYQDGASITCTGPVTLYAVWKEDSSASVTAPSQVNGVYQISSAANLAWMAKQSETASLTGSFKQTASIDLSGKVWTPIGSSTYPFKGSYDGGGYTISNLIIQGNGSYQGLFGAAYSATLKNIRLSSGRVSGNTNIGGIVGYSLLGSITDCISFCNISGSSTSGAVGGIVGYSTSTISKCYNYGDVSGNSKVGGILGYGSAIITSCISKGVIEGVSDVGGIVGNISGSITDCYFEGSILTASGGYAIGYAGNVSNCYARATFTTTQSLSNYGLTNASFTNCVFEINGVKRFKVSNFNGWVITLQNQPLPKQLAWMGVISDSSLTASKLTQLGYTSV